jgi:RNA polymerase sigma factor (sigma-70 family)
MTLMTLLPIFSNNLGGCDMKADVAEILLAAKSGDNTACEKLYHMTYGPAYATVLSIVKNENDVEDILQEAYIHVFTRLDSVESPEKFQSWVNCIVANQAKDWLRKKKPALFGDFGGGDDGDDSEFEDTIKDNDESFSPQAQLDKKMMAQLFAKMFESLPEDQRLCIIMYYRDNLTVQEIADTLDVPLPTVKSRLLYAKKKIKASVLEEERASGLKLYSGIPFTLYMLHQEADSAYVLPFSSVYAKIQTTIANASTAPPLSAEGGKAVSSAAAQGSKAAAAKTGTSAATHAFAAIASHPAIAAIIASAAIATSVAVPALNTARASSVSAAASSVSAELVEQATSSVSESEAVASSGKAFYPVVDYDYPKDFIYSDFVGKYPYVVTDTHEMWAINERLANYHSLTFDNTDTGYKEDLLCSGDFICIQDTHNSYQYNYNIQKMTIVSKTQCVFNVRLYDGNTGNCVGPEFPITVTGDSYDPVRDAYYITVQVENNDPVKYYPATLEEYIAYIKTIFPSS